MLRKSSQAVREVIEYEEASIRLLEEERRRLVIERVLRQARITQHLQRPDRSSQDRKRGHRGMPHLEQWGATERVETVQPIDADWPVGVAEPPERSIPPQGPAGQTTQDGELESIKSQISVVKQGLADAVKALSTAIESVRPAAGQRSQ